MFGEHALAIAPSGIPANHGSDVPGTTKEMGSAARRQPCAKHQQITIVWSRVLDLFMAVENVATATRALFITE
jgi:hypothetical protein